MNNVALNNRVDAICTFASSCLEVEFIHQVESELSVESEDYVIFRLEVGPDLYAAVRDTDDAGIYHAFSAVGEWVYVLTFNEDGDVVSNHVRIDHLPPAEREKLTTLLVNAHSTVMECAK